MRGECQSFTRRSASHAKDAGLRRFGMVEVDFGTASAELVEFSQEVQARRFQADSLPLEERLKVKDQLFTQWMPHRSLSVTPGNAIAAEHDDFARTIAESGQPEVTANKRIECSWLLSRFFTR